MRLFFTLSLLVTILCGCSVTIDKPQSEEEKEQQSEEELAPTTRSELNVEGELVVEEQKSLSELLDSMLYIDVRSTKRWDAQPLQYLALGDSLTRGVGDELGRFGYTKRLATTLEKWPTISEVELDNRGKNGRRSDQLLALLEKGHYDNELPGADLITITLGGNDVMKVVKADIFSLKKEMFEKELEPFKKRYQEIIQYIRQHNKTAPIILIGFYNPFSIVTDEYTPFATIINEWNSSILEIAREDRNACYVPIADLFTSNDEMVYHTDFFHPNASGYEKMTARVISSMKACDIEKMSGGRIGFEE
ncbi:GDSL-type esterase/lipase family protein [Lysinibacillus sp. 54212]|uniref:GDSL-type esterase/lipase family protein n=1 Tax=Lysinibacillus sp. 54212 TaxID=3119829 RepID=UPI002FC728B4